MSTFFLAKKYDRGVRSKPERLGQPIPAGAARSCARPAHRGNQRSVIGGPTTGRASSITLSRIVSQLVFKPFIYAAAFDSAVDGVQPIVRPPRPLTMSPPISSTTASNYTPNNYSERFMGRVTARDASPIR